MIRVGLFSYFARKPVAARVAPFAICEPVGATAVSAHHIRRVGPEGLKLGGGIPVAPLCGDESVTGGWDVSDGVTPAAVQAGSTPREGDGHIFLCRGCTDAYNALPDSDKMPAMFDKN